jgi:hypothetical protein
MRSMLTVPTPAANEYAGQAPLPEGAFCIPSTFWSQVWSQESSVPNNASATPSAGSSC